MKSDHRRELHANELEKLAKTIGAFFEKHGKKVLLGLLAAIAVSIGVFVALRFGGQAEKQGSQDLMTALTTEEYLNVANNPDLAGTKLAAVARLKAGELQLVDGIRQYIERSESGMQELKKAKKNLSQVLETKDLLSDNLRERALYCLAVTMETLSAEDTDVAIAAYEKLLEEFPESLYKEVAKKRIEVLATNDAKQFYAFLASEKRKPGGLSTPDEIRRKRLRAAHGGRDVTERKIELPRIPPGLATDLDDPPKKPKTTPEKKSKALPFPKAPKKSTPKKSAKSKTGKTGTKPVPPMPKKK